VNMIPSSLEISNRDPSHSIRVFIIVVDGTGSYEHNVAEVLIVCVKLMARILNGTKVVITSQPCLS
jgi:hypothetical protein